jgi:hypothetical protein
LLKNPIYRGKIVHRGTVYEGEHEAIVDEELWGAVQQRLQEKAPPRRRPKNDPQKALLRGLLSDPEGRPMVPTYATKGARRYAYYETRKDLVRPDDQPATRIGQGQLERHLIMQLTGLLEDEHALRCISGQEEGGTLRDLFAKAKLTAASLAFDNSRKTIIPQVIAAMQVRADKICVRLSATALGCDDSEYWEWSMPLPARKPFREAKLRIDTVDEERPVDTALIALVGDALVARGLVLASPELSLNQIAKREGRCRKQLAKLVRLSWLNPHIVEAIVDGRAPQRLTRKRLLDAELPLAWSDQEKLLGLAD